MTRRTFTRSLGVAGPILLALLVAAWLMARPHGRPADGPPTVERAGADPSTPKAASSGGIRPRQTDPAMPPLEWSREGVGDAEPSVVSLNDYLKSIASTTDAAALEELLHVLEWTMPFGQEGAVGEALSECAKRFEPQLDEQCHWETDFVVTRTSDDAGELQLVRSRVSESSHSAICSAYASCATGAWADAGPMPMPDSLGDSFAFSRKGRGTYWIGSESMPSAEKYRALGNDVERRLRDIRRLDGGDASPVYRYNEMYTQHELREFERMLDEDANVDD